MSSSRFRAGFRQAFAWCPFIKVSEEDKKELQHTNTFRVTVTRSHRCNTSYTPASIKTNNTVTDNEACLQRQKRTCSPHNLHLAKTPEDTISSAAKPAEHDHWLLSWIMTRTFKMRWTQNHKDKKFHYLRENIVVTRAIPEGITPGEENFLTGLGDDWHGFLKKTKNKKKTGLYMTMKPIEVLLLTPKCLYMWNCCIYWTSKRN